MTGDIKHDLVGLVDKLQHDAMEDAGAGANTYPRVGYGTDGQRSDGRAYGDGC